MRKTACALVIMLSVVAGAVKAQKPYNEADSWRMRVIETWQKYADKLNWGKGQCLAICPFAGARRRGSVGR